MTDSGFFLDPEAVRAVAARQCGIAGGLDDCAGVLAGHRFGGWSGDDEHARSQVLLGDAATALARTLRRRAAGLRNLGETVVARVEAIAEADRAAFDVRPGDREGSP